jgi:hypothetical protein
MAAAEATYVKPIRRSCEVSTHKTSLRESIDDGLVRLDTPRGVRLATEPKQNALANPRYIHIALNSPKTEDRNCHSKDMQSLRMLHDPRNLFIDLM